MLTQAASQSSYGVTGPRRFVRQAWNPVEEACHAHALVGGRNPGALEHLGKRVLQDVFRQCSIADTPLQIGEERAMVLEQHGKRRLRLERVGRSHVFSIGLALDPRVPNHGSGQAGRCPVLGVMQSATLRYRIEGRQ